MGAVTGKKLEPVKCGSCEFSSKRITAVEKHIEEHHGMSAKQMYDDINGGPTKCACGCGEETTWLNWKNGYSAMLKGHNAAIYDIYDEEKAKQIAATRGANFKGQSWSKGLTKESDARVRARGEATSAGRKLAFEEGKIKIWSKGLTKESDQRIKINAEKLTQGYASGEYVPWAKGLTKQTDYRIKLMADKVAMTHKTESLRKRLDELKRLSIDEVKNRVEEGGKFKITGDMSNYVNDATPSIYVTCNTCGDQTYSTLRKLQHHRCYNCDPSGSKMQADVAAAIEALHVPVKKNIRGIIQGTHRGAELDIYVPTHNTAVEFNGLYWHCNVHKSNNYHQNKTEQCGDQNIALIHIFEDEWREKRSIVESIFKHRFGLTTNKIGARTCTVKTLTTNERREFFNKNHIDGDTNAKETFALVDANNNILAAMSLRVPFHKKHASSIEIARMCNAIDSTVTGGLSRLTAAAGRWAKTQGYADMISYVDTRLGGHGNSWSMAGWTLNGETPPRFWWTDFKSRYNRFKFKADKSRNMTEAQVADEAGVFKIYGCKNLIFKINVS